MLEPYCLSQLSTVWLTDQVGNFVLNLSQDSSMLPSFGVRDRMPTPQTGKTKQKQVAQCATTVSGDVTIPEGRAVS